MEVTKQTHTALETVKVRHPEDPREFMIVRTSEFQENPGKYEIWEPLPSLDQTSSSEDSGAVEIPENYHRRKKEELKNYARDLGIEEYEEMSKEQLIDAIGEFLEQEDS